MRVLIYGFGPYRHFQTNVTEKILRRLPKRRQVKTVVFPVRFHKRQFIEAIQEHKPEVVLGLGQCSRGRRLRIEARAVNRRRNNKNEKNKLIVSDGSPSLSTTLKLDLGRHARFSNNAGDYVCNYSAYVILDFLGRRHLPVRFGFIHIPHRYAVQTAVRTLVKVLSENYPTRPVKS